jgi:hydroxyacylglutathione hydrolase
MQIETLVLGPLDTNCYIAWCEVTQQAVVIDPADSGDVISEFILRENLDLQAILLTHAHFDHVLGLLELKLNFAQASILMHKADMFLLESVQSRALHWLKYEVDPTPPPDRFITEGDEVVFGEEALRVIETPGHTPGSVCFYDDQHIFTGDTLFADGIGAADHSYSNKRDLHKSLERLRALTKNRRGFAGHGTSF